MHLCITNLAIIVSANGLSPSWRQAIILTYDEILWIDTWEQSSVKFESEFKIFIEEIAFEIVVCKMAPT